MKAIALIAGEYPLASETFVWREVQALRQRGHKVIAIGLRAPLHRATGVEDADLVVYGTQARQTMASALTEVLSHPIRSIRTFCRAIRDAVFPGETVMVSNRAKLLIQVFAAIGIAQRVRDYKIDHIHCHFAHAPATLAMYVAHQLGLPFSFTGHANDLFHRRVLLKRKLQRAAGIACISQWHSDWYRSIDPGCTLRSRIIRCGVHVPSTFPASILQEIPTRLICVGRLVEKKGFDTLVRAYALLKAKSPNGWRLTVVGDGPESERLRRLADELGVATSIEFVGALTHDQVRSRLCKADIFVMPCRTDSAGDRDGIPVAMMEAMAAGLVVVGGDLPAIRELIRDGETGVLVSGDHRELAHRIERLVDETEASVHMAETGYLHVRDEFGTDTNIDRLVSMFDESKNLNRGELDYSASLKATVFP